MFRDIQKLAEDVKKPLKDRLQILKTDRLKGILEKNWNSISRIFSTGTGKSLETHLEGYSEDVGVRGSSITGLVRIRQAIPSTTVHHPVSTFNLQTMHHFTKTECNPGYFKYINMTRSSISIIPPSSPLNLIPLAPIPPSKISQHRKNGRAQRYHGGTDHPLHR